MTKYVIYWAHKRIGKLYYRRAETGYEGGKVIQRSANLSEAMIFNGYDDANAEFIKHIEPDSEADICVVTDKEIFKAKLSDEPTRKKINGISS